MSLNSLLAIHAAFEVFFGLGTLLVPALIVQPMAAPGTSFGEPLPMVLRLYGALALSMGLILWAARQSKDAGLRRWVVLAQFIHNALGLMVMLPLVLNGTLPAAAWLNIIVWIVLTLAYSYFYFIKPERAG